MSQCTVAGATVGVARFSEDVRKPHHRRRTVRHVYDLTGPYNTVLTG